MEAFSVKAMTLYPLDFVDNWNKTKQVQKFEAWIKGVESSVNGNTQQKFKDLGDVVEQNEQKATTQQKEVLFILNIFLSPNGKE